MSWASRLLVIVLLQMGLSVTIGTAFTGNEAAILKRQKKLSAVIDKTVGLQSDTMKRRIPKSYDAFTSTEGSIEHRCWGELGQAHVERSSCCSPNDVRHIYNAKVEKDQLVLFRKPKDSQSSLSVSSQQGKQQKHNPPKTVNSTETALPSVTSVKSLKRLPFKLPVEERYAELNCSSVFNGTLHVISRSSVNNVYHAIGDNLMPFISEILMDAELEPEFLHLPRMLLTGISGVPPGNIMMDDGTVPHMQLVVSLASAGLKSLGDIVASGMCFRRIVWGHGPHLLYLDTLSTLRRKASEFARHLVQEFYDIKLPTGLATVSAAPGPAANANKSRRNLEAVSPKVQQIVTKSKQGEALKRARVIRPTTTTTTTTSSTASGTQQRVGELSQAADGTMQPSPAEFDGGAATTSTTTLVPYPEMAVRSLRIVVYTRGNSGYGRTIQGEDQLVSTLNSLGHSAVLCCNFKHTSIDEQLSLAVYADAIIGLHGAALAHGVFMRPGTVSIELKTKYGYDSVLFPLIAESHLGIHAQVDLRQYFIPGGHRPIDRPLIQRIIDVLSTATVLAKVQGSTSAENSTTNDTSPPTVAVLGADISSQTDSLIYDYSIFITPNHREQLGNTSMIIGLGSSVIVHTKSFRHPGDMLIAFGARHSVVEVEQISMVRSSSSALPARREETTDSIFGPFISNQTDICYGMIMSKVREQLGHKERNSFHCNICTSYNGMSGIRRLIGQEMYEV